MPSKDTPAQLLSYLKFLRELGFLFVEETAAPASSKEQLLDELQPNVLSCTRCLLHEGRTQAVFGEGSAEATLMFIGEAPGEQEDRQGRPFVGAAGKLLTRLIEDIGLSRKQVFIGNIIKCRPPGNRDPLPAEVETCLPYLLKQIEIIRPGIICTLGRHATMTLLKTSGSIMKMRGREFSFQDITLVPTLHPANALYQRRNLPLIEEDFQLLKRLHQKLTSS